MVRNTQRVYRKSAVTAALILILAIGGIAYAIPAQAQTQGISGVIANQPGATLLLPYFEVNLDNPKASNTYISMTNTSATAVLGHVIIWTDLSVPALEFNVYLTGYDLWRMNIGSFLTTGVMDSTASAGQDPFDTISPKGTFSQDINFASCNGQLPNGTIPAAQLQGVQNALIGQASINYGSNLCGGLMHPSDTARIARGYITIDTVNSCSQQFPNDPSYIQNVITFQNVLEGDSYYVSLTKNRAVAQPLVSIAASFTDPDTTTPTHYTFYGRYDGVAWDSSDHRQPTATSFAARYINAGSPQGFNFMNQGTQAIVWRDSKIVQNPFTCGTMPSWYPLSQEQIVLFDEQEQPQVPMSCVNLPCPQTPGLLPFPAETQKVQLNSAALPTTFAEGWGYFDLNTTVAGESPNMTDPAAAQAWMIMLYDQAAGAGGNNNGSSWEMGEDATLLDSAEHPIHTAPGH
jgi:hypothetical protein